MFRQVFINQSINSIIKRTINRWNDAGAKKALVLMANGSEDIEVVATVDVLRRGGIDVKLCSIENNDNKPLICAHNVRLVADVHIDEIQGQEFDAIIVPGGSKGTETIGSCEKSRSIILNHYQKQKIIAGICAGPIAISMHLYDADENARQHEITCYPDVAYRLQAKFQSINLNMKVVDSQVNHRRLITSQGPATAIQFALRILSCLTNEKMADEIRQKLLA